MAITIVPKQQVQQESDWDKVTKGIGLARDIYGIYSDTQKLDQAKADSALKMQEVKRQNDAEARQKEQFQMNKTEFNQKQQGGLKPEELAKNDVSYEPKDGYQSAFDIAQKKPVWIKEKAKTPSPEESFRLFGNPVKPGSKQGSTLQDVDPATLVAIHVPPDRQAKALEEIGAAQNTSKNAKQILDAYDAATKKIKDGLYTPEATNTDIKTLHTLLGPTFKDVEGTVRQAAMDNVFNNITPNNLDRFVDGAYDKKRDALVGYLQGKSSSPTAQAYGIDLKNYKNTTIDPSLISTNKKVPLETKQAGIGLSDGIKKLKTAPKLSDQDKTAIAWAKANPKEPAAAKILKLHGM